MRFQVPQFIETESKIIGPLTIKQFMYLAAGGILVFVLRYVFYNLFYWLLASAPIVFLAVALAFYRIDGIPLPRYMMLAVYFLTGPKKYIFKKGGGINGSEPILPGENINHGN